jgi:hypothetical protein
LEHPECDAGKQRARKHIAGGHFTHGQDAEGYDEQGDVQYYGDEVAGQLAQYSEVDLGRGTGQVVALIAF